MIDPTIKLPIEQLIVLVESSFQTVEKMDEFLDAIDKAEDERISAEIDIMSPDAWKKMEAVHKEFFPMRKALSIAKRKIASKTPEYEDIPKYGDVMSLKSFVENVRSGGFIDYDGFGKYAKDGKMSNITIVPSDIKAGFVLDQFDSVVWFNR